MKPLEILLALLVPVLLFACPSAFSFQLEELQQIIQSGKVASVEQLLEKLPSSMLENFTLMKASQSSQVASPENPRAILFGTDAKLILTFNGESTQAGYRKVEVMAFNSQRKAFEIYAIDFAREADRPATLSKPNPGRCTLCHGVPPKPIWDEYKTWHGAYGQEDDVEKSEEYRNFSKEAYTHHPRYKHLIRSSAQFPLPYHDNGQNIKRRISPVGNTLPNTRLTQHLAELLAEELADRIKHSPKFKTYIHPFLFYSLGCDVIQKSSFEKPVEKIADLLKKYGIAHDDPRLLTVLAEEMVHDSTRHSVLNYSFSPALVVAGHKDSLLFGDFNDGLNPRHFIRAVSTPLYNELNPELPLVLNDPHENSLRSSLRFIAACNRLLSLAISDLEMSR